MLKTRKSFHHFFFLLFPLPIILSFHLLFFVVKNLLTYFFSFLLRVSSDFLMGWYCAFCPYKMQDFDLCIGCKTKVGHPHNMEKLGFDLDDGSSPTDLKQANPQEARKQSIQRCIHSLVHACQCRDANCRLPSCQKMKRVVTHTKNCKRKTNGGCPICKQLIALCCYHAKHCLDGNKCPVPFCHNIKQKLKNQALQQRYVLFIIFIYFFFSWNIALSWIFFWGIAN